LIKNNFASLDLFINVIGIKAEFNNVFTGKLSDFAGLFALPFLMAAFYPKHRKLIHIFTAILFVFWKSEFSQFIIDFCNTNACPINRVIDLADNVALISIPLSYFTLRYRCIIVPPLRTVLQKVLIVISCLAFMAASMPPHAYRRYVNIGKEYQFDFSKKELISRLNKVQIGEVKELNNWRRRVHFDKKTNTYHFHNKSDTLAALLHYEKTSHLDTIPLKTSFFVISISGNETGSTLRLINVCKLVQKFDDKDYRDKTIRQFERRIVRKIKDYH
jgi:hypothetical protein